GKVRLRAQVKKLQGDWPKQVSGLLIEKSGAQRSACEVKLSVGGFGPAAAEARSLWRMLLYAFLGGLILNIMPCVLPVIALKILGFVREARDEPARVRKLGLIYTAGVLSSFFILALIVVGFQVAWGFQFTDPYFLIAMTTLVTLVALNLFGVFEVTLGSSALTAANALASKEGGMGTYF